jgi:hypothetical protein
VTTWRPVAAGEAPPDVRIERGRVLSVPFEGPEHTARVFASPGGLTIAVNGVARYGITEGSSIMVDAEPSARPEDVQLYLTGAAFGAILHQRSLFPLHGSALLVGGKAVALTGPSRMGKSTLAAFLAKRGYPLLTDDVAVMTSVGPAKTAMWPGSARLKLDAASLQVVGSSTEDLELAGGNRSKYHFAMQSVDAPDSGLIPVSSVYLIEDGDRVDIQRLSPADAVHTVAASTYCIDFVNLLDRKALWFRLAAEIAAGLKVRRLYRPRGFEHLEEIARTLEQEWHGDGMLDVTLSGGS